MADPTSYLLLPPHLETPDVETSSDDYARRFAGPAGQYFLDVQAQALDRLMREHSGASVLDVGGGHAQLMPTFLSRGCRVTMLGSDDSTHARVRSQYGDAVRCDTGDILNLPYPRGSFDLVVAVRLVAHVEAWRRLLSELCRVSRRTVIIDYASWRSLNALTPVLFRFKKSLEGNTREYASFMPSTLSAEFGRHGFVATGSYSQFFLPMFAHRAAGGARWLRRAERIVRAVGLTRAFGSPILLRADRRDGG